MSSGSAGLTCECDAGGGGVKGGSGKGCISKLSVTATKRLRESISTEERFLLTHNFSTQLLDLDHLRKGRSV